MFPTIQVSTILKKWQDAILNSTEINDYCMDKYDKLPKVCIGLDARNKPEEEDLPVIAVFPDPKTEGYGLSDYTYLGSIMWGIYQETVEKVDRSVEYIGIREADDIGQLIYKTIAEINPDYPISQIEYNVGLIEHMPQYFGHMAVTLTIPVLLGSDLAY